MLLAIDSGNTNIVFALYRGAESLGIWRIHEDPKRTPDELAVLFYQLIQMAGYDFEEIDDVIIASVVPQTLRHLKTFMGRTFDHNPLVVGESSVKLGMEVLIDKPASAGADRLVNGVAGFHLYGGPLFIIDFGTATTIDTIDHEGNYRGGIIAPGVNLAREALYNAAAQLPPVPFARTEKVMATSTVHAVQSGCYWGYVGMIEGLVSRLKVECRDLWGDRPAHVIATGGLSSIFSSDLDCVEHVREDLTLEGLRILFERNKNNALIRGVVM